jgi:hypothetical protein
MGGQKVIGTPRVDQGTGSRGCWLDTEAGLETHGIAVLPDLRTDARASCLPPGEPVRFLTLDSIDWA